MRWKEDWDKKCVVFLFCTYIFIVVLYCQLYDYTTFSMTIPWGPLLHHRSCMHGKNSAVVGTSASQCSLCHTSGVDIFMQHTGFCVLYFVIRFLHCNMQYLTLQNAELATPVWHTEDCRPGSCGWLWQVEYGNRSQMLLACKLSRYFFLRSLSHLKTFWSLCYSICAPSSQFCVYYVCIADARILVP